MKRQPLIADLVLAHGLMSFPYKPKVLGTLRACLMEAKRFVLDVPAASKFGEIVRDYPQTAVEGVEFAKSPFPLMYVEWPTTEYWRIVNGLDMAEDAADRMAFLYNGSSLFVLCAFKDETKPALMPLMYRLNTDWPFAAQQKFAQDLNRSRLYLDQLFWGTSYGKVDPDMRKALRQQHSIESIVETRTDESKAELVRMIEDQAGDLRAAILMLLYLNSTSSIRVDEEIPAKQGMINHKTGVYLKHSVIKLNMSKVDREIKRTFGHQSVWRREHDVRGHWCHDKIAKKAQARGHVHEWWQIPRGRSEQWFCPKCTGLKWWQPDHRRGHKEKGVVVQEYEVTA